MKIKDLHLEHPAIYLRIMELQVEQGNRMNDELSINQDRGQGNFLWDDTAEGWQIWDKVRNRDFDPWYKFWKDKGMYYSPGVPPAGFDGEDIIKLNPID